MSWYNLFSQSAAATDLPSTTTMMSTIENLQTTISSFSLLDIIQSNIIKSLSWIIFECFVVLSIVCLAVHPILRGVTKGPLLTYLGIEYKDIKLSPSRIKLTISDMTLLPSRSFTLQLIILAIFPSANVQIHNGIDINDYPESRITISKLSIKIRISSMSESQTVANKLHWFKGYGLNLLLRLIPRPIIIIRLKNVSIEVEKCYLAPEPPVGYRTISELNDWILPFALPLQSTATSNGLLRNDGDGTIRLPQQTNESSSSIGLPTFHQDYFLESIQTEDVCEATNLTFFIERWLDHAISQIKKKNVKKGGLNKKQSWHFQPKKGDDDASDGLDESDRTKEEMDSASQSANNEEKNPKQQQQQTYDEKMNNWISWSFTKSFHLLTLDIQQVSIIISGVGSDVVKLTREKYVSSSSEVNLQLAKIPKSQRSLTVIGAESITLNFTPDLECNALLALVGLHVKAGTPTVAAGAVSSFASSSTTTVTSADNNDIPVYTWHTIVHPFNLLAEVKGLLPFLIWAINYDHYWSSKFIGINLSISTEVALNLSSEHLHTVLLHLDDYTDPNSPFNRWVCWLRDVYRDKTLDISDEEKAEYRNNYARIMAGDAKGGKKKKTNVAKAATTTNEDMSVATETKLITKEQLKDMEKRMTKYEIMSLRCYAMKQKWRIPKSNKDFEAFLRNTRSSICDKGNEESATPMNETNLSPFQRVYATPLHVLVTLIRENSSILAPRATIELSVSTLHIDFPYHTTPTQELSSIPSSITVSGLFFGIDQENVLHVGGGDEKVGIDNKLDNPRPFLNLSLDIHAVKWDVVADDDDMEVSEELPLFRDRSPVGIVYMSEDAVSSKHVLSLGLSIAVTPTLEPEQYFGLEFKACDMSILVNPLPIISAIQNLIELSDIPFQPPDVKTTDLNDEYDDVDSKDGDVDESISVFGIQSNISISIENVQLIFLIDRKKVPRGILQLNVHGINVEFESGGLLGELSFSTEPLVLRAARMNALSSQNGFIGTTLMPYQPIVDVDGANVQLIGKESMSTVKLDIVIGSESLFFNTSPSTIVAVFGVVSSLDPFLDWDQGGHESKEEELKRIEAQKKLESEHLIIKQREVVRRIFKEVDVDGSGTLSEDELELVILKIFDENNKEGKTTAKIPTPRELKRERRHLLATVDLNRTNEITFQELDDAFYRLVNGIDDNNVQSSAIKRIGPKLLDGEDHEIYYDHWAKEDSFLSGPIIRKLVYYDDLREYASSSEVYRITGDVGLGSSSHFPPPSLWRQGEGINLFWDLYERETGCTRNSFDGQNILLVQRKLVRILCNYEFAKYCWKTLVQPEIYAATETDTTTDAIHWLLDKDPKTKIKSGVIDRLVRHVDTEVTNEIKPLNTGSDIQYDISLNVEVGSAILRFGSSHAFTNPLFEARFSQFKINASALVSSQSVWFVPEKELAEENHIGNRVDFQTMISAMYLNTKHNHMECFIEPYPTFGEVTYQVFPDEGDEKKDASYSIHLNEPRFLNINTSRSFFETASVLSKVIFQSDPDTFRRVILDRDIGFIKNFWCDWDSAKKGVMTRDDTLDMLVSLINTHWKDEVAGLTREERNHFASTFRDLALRQGGRGDGMISLDNVIFAFKTYTSRCYFSGSNELQITNNIGRELHATSQTNLGQYGFNSSTTSDFEASQSKAFTSIDDSHSQAIPINGRISIVTKGYKMIDDIPVSPYQSLMFPLKRRKSSSSSRKRRNASGFSPYLTIVPKTDSLDSISLIVRSSVHLCTQISIKIRIVRLGKMGKGKEAKAFLKKGSTTKIDLSKKNLMAALRRAVEGAPVVYENEVNEGDVAPIPLDVLDSSHYHALLVQPISKDPTKTFAWRDPVPLLKSFLFNPTNIREVTKCHTLSGIVVQKERLNVHLSDKRRYSPLSGDSKKSILKRTAWDVSIQVVPFFLLSNSLTFPIVIRSWQETTKDSDDELWDEPALPIPSGHGMNEDQSSEDEDLTYTTPSIVGGRNLTEDNHMSNGKGSTEHYSQDHVAVGQTLRLSGIDLQESLFIQVSQQINASEEMDFLWTNPLQINLSRMKSGINSKGVKRLPKLVLDLGDNCDCLVDVSLEGGTKVPVCTIYSPYWIMNKSGAKLEYKVAGQSKRYLDSGTGGLPIMIHGSESENTNERYKNVSKAISVLSVEYPSRCVAEQWWNTKTNGTLVIQKRAMIEQKGKGPIRWSDKIELDVAGTHGEIECNNQFVFNVSIDSLAGAFHRSNLINITPRFIVKNMLHIHISIIPLIGGLYDALRKARQLRQELTKQDEKLKQDLSPGDSLLLYHFHNISGGLEKPYRWVAFRVNASHYGASYKPKWHLVPIDLPESSFFGEHDGCNDTMCGILEVKTHSSDEGAMLVSITHATVPPFCIENRSNDHILRFVQDDADAVVFELPPMSSASYTWDSSLGKKKLRAVVIPVEKSKNYQLDAQLKQERDEEEERTLDTYDSDDDNETVQSGSTKDPLLQALKKGTTGQTSLELNKTARYRSPRKKAVYTIFSRSYNLKKVGEQQQLPCPSSKESESGHQMMSSSLFAHIRIVAGTKTISFSDSTWLANQVEAGQLKKGGPFKASLCEMNIEGVGLYIMDDYPKEVMAVILRDIQLQKPMGSIKLTARCRHFQVDAMLPSARYPIIIQSSPMGVDRRDPLIKGSNALDLIMPENVDTNECFWMKNEEKPIPVFETEVEYVPQKNMTWVPSINVFICPLKLWVDVDYILRIMGMIVDSVNKCQDQDDVARNLHATSSANDKLKYVTRGQAHKFMTYIENLYISPVTLDIELNIKSDDADHADEGDSNLTLHSIAQATNSAAVAGLMSWVINVGSNFAHVSPTFRYSDINYSDTYCALFDLFEEISKPYTNQTIKQGYKVIFSMQLLGDPSHLFAQYKAGFSDLFIKTRDELVVGGQDGVGKGVSSLVQNVVGGTLFAIGKATGGVADTLDSMFTNDATSNHLKPKKASSSGGKHPDNAIDGVVQGTQFLGETVVHGLAGIVGNPYRGAKSGGAVGFTKGVASGVGGLVTAPFVGALGFIAKSSDGMGATTQCLELGVIDARCRPARVVPWGRPMSDNGLSYLKAIGIRVHTVRYQKVRKRLVQQRDSQDGEVDPQVTSKEYKRIRAAEERRKYPPKKLISIMHEKDKYHYVTSPVRPKLLADAPGNLVLSHYAVTFEETLILRSSDLQLGDTVSMNFWNNRGIKASTTRATPLGVCKISVGDMYSAVLNVYEEQLRRKEMNLAEKSSTVDDLIVPAPQECALFRPCKARSPIRMDIFDAIGEEMAAIEKSDQDQFAYADSSSDSDDDSDFLDGGGRKAKEEDPSSMVKANERLFGSVSLSFFPIPW